MTVGPKILKSFFRGWVMITAMTSTQIIKTVTLHIMIIWNKNKIILKINFKPTGLSFIINYMPLTSNIILRICKSSVAVLAFPLLNLQMWELRYLVCVNMLMCLGRILQLNSLKYRVTCPIATGQFSSDLTLISVSG